MKTFVHLSIPKQAPRGLALFILMLSFSCKHEPEIVELTCPDYDVECVEIPPEPLQGYDYIGDSLNISDPCINPNNSDEVIFVRDGKLYKYNLLSGNFNLIYEGVILSIPKWSRKDWILIHRPDNQIWKIKSSGDSLAQLTFIGQNNSPEWNFDGNKFIHRDNTLNLHIIRDESGTPLDTSYYSGYSWQNPNDLIAAVGFEISIVNPNTDSQTVLFDIDNEISTNGIVWSIDYCQVIWSSEEGIFVSDVSNGNTKELISSCSASQFMFPTISKSKWIYWLKQDISLVDESTVFLKRRLCRMKEDGTCVEEIEIPFLE